MLIQVQCDHFKTFGFLLLRDYFSADEAATIKAEYKSRCDAAANYVPFDGTKRQVMNMMVPDTPFYCSLLDDRGRFLGIAEQLAGKVLGMSVSITRLVSNTYWHYDSTTYDLTSLQFGCYLESVRAETGALRVIPGSHRQPFQDEIGAIQACDYAWIRQDNDQEAGATVDDIPAFICETDPQDGGVVAREPRLHDQEVGPARIQPQDLVGVTDGLLDLGEAPAGDSSSGMCIVEQLLRCLEATDSRGGKRTGTVLAYVDAVADEEGLCVELGVL